VYVTDVADSAIVAAMSQQAVGQVYNIAPLDEVRFSDFAAALAKAKGKKLRKLTVPMSLAYAFGLLVEWWAKLWRFKQPPLFTRSGLCFFEEGMFIDGSKIVRELGWQPKVPLEEGARLYVEWRCAQGKKKTI
jgi:nucleoside-diphosphate-sugar epimerase